MSSGNQGRGGTGPRRMDMRSGGGKPYQSPYNSQQGSRPREAGPRPTLGGNEGPQSSAPIRANAPRLEKQMQPLTAGKMRMIPIGGQGEIGRSCWYLEHAGEALLLDCGMGFAPFGVKGGVDYLLPHLDFLTENKAKIKGFLVSNPHEEHCGALMNMIEALEPADLFLPPILAEISAESLENREGLKVNVLANGESFKVGQNFIVTPFQIGFSCMDAYAFLIETQGKRVFFFAGGKMDYTPPIIEGRTSLTEIASRVTEKGVDILVSCSSNVESTGYAASELSVQKKLADILQQCKKRVFVFASASSSQRLEVLLRAAAKEGRKVCMLGAQLKRFYQAGCKLGYHKELGLEFLAEDELESKDKDKRAVIILGTLEGEVLEPFMELAYRRHASLELEHGDVIVLSANPPLGTSRVLANAVDQLFVQGIQVIGGRDAGVNVQSIAAQEELKFLYNLTRPKHFIPSHGEVRQLVLHAELMGKCGLDPRSIFIIDNGNTIDLDQATMKAEMVGSVQTPPVFFSKAIDATLTPRSIDERKNLSEEGNITIALAMDSVEGKLIAGPTLKTTGSSLATSKEWIEVEANVIREARIAVLRALQQNQKDISLLKRLISDVLNKKLKEKYGMANPVITIFIQDLAVPRK